MIPNGTNHDPLQSSQVDTITPRFFIDATIDANPDDGDWWLDIGDVNIPGALAL